MRLVKKICCVFILSISFLSVQHIVCSELSMDERFDDFDTFLNDPKITAFLDENTFEFKKRHPTPADIFTLLNDLGILDEFVDIFKEDIYLRTNPLNRRNVVDMPIGMQDKKYSYENWTLGAELFWNHRHRVFFSQKCSGFQSYFAMNGLIYKLDAITKKLIKDGAPFGNFDDPVDVLLLFKNGTIQDRRFGFLLQAHKKYRNINFFFKLPFFYQESNYFFEEKEREAMEEKLGVLDEEEETRLSEAHLISDRLGFGDLRFVADYPLTDNGRFMTRLGLQLTVPLNWSLAKGLKGSHFKPITTKPELDITEILSLVTDNTTKPDAFIIMRDLAYKAIDHASANLIDYSQGNDRHLGIGAQMNTMWPLNLFIKRPWTDDIFIKGRIYLEYLFPARENRYFAGCLDDRLFDMRDFRDSSKAIENMAFLEDQFINKLFPSVYEATIYPGIVFRWTSKATYETDRWGLHLGTDMWVRTEETIENICLDDANKIDRLKIQLARKLMAYQSKVLGSLFFKSHRDNKDWIFSLDADATWWTSGIGYDWTISLNMEVNF